SEHFDKHPISRFQAIQSTEKTSQRTSITATAFAGNSTANVSPSIFAPVKLTGFTMSGWSNVLWALSLSAVRIRALASELPLGIVAERCAALVASRFTSEMLSLPLASREAVA